MCFVCVAEKELSKCSSKMFHIDQNLLRKKSKHFSKRVSKQYSGKVGYIIEQYTREKQLRKKYFNMLQELRGNIQVFCRVRPILPREQRAGYKSCVQIGTGISKIQQSFEQNGNNNKPTGSTDSLFDTINDNNDDEKITIFDIERNISLSFNFDKIFNPQSSQRDVFNYVSPMIQSVLDGYNVCIFAYGQTGSGKTYTMAGPKDDPGVNIQALRLLFNKMSDDNDVTFKVCVSLLEIYNEKIIDLLSNSKSKHNVNQPRKLSFQTSMSPSPHRGMNNRPASARLSMNRKQTDHMHAGGKLKPRENSDGSIVVPGLTIAEMSSVEQILEYLEMGHANRKSGVTDMNEHSSRSHLVLTVYITATNHISKKFTKSKLHLIDLAGSERNKKSRAKGNTLKEAIAINSSLASLGDVIAAKSAKTSHIPYRRSILTYLLKDSLDKDCKTVMITQISPLDRDTSESSCSLKFANRVKTVELGKAQKHTFNLNE